MNSGRHKDGNWNVGDKPTMEGAQLAVLMDIRDELKQLNKVFSCFNFQQMPKVLTRIDKRLAKNIKL
jgi:predicted SpoU family rRNA methylase